jgi:hypothetical protein
MDNMGNESNIIAVQDLVMTGNLAKLQPMQKMEYYNKLCDDLGLNPLTKPFQLLVFNGKEILYATKDCTDQLRKLNGVSITSLEGKETNGVYVVTAKAQDKHGRIDTATGALTIANLKGDALANALMKCETKAKRRVTLSISGLGFLDESEVESMPGAVVKEVPPDQPKLEDKSNENPDKNIESKPEVNHPTVEGAHVLTYGEEIGKWYWALNGKERAQYLPTQSELRKVDGKWFVMAKGA